MTLKAADRSVRHSVADVISVPKDRGKFAVDNALQNKITLKLGKRQIVPPPVLGKARELVLGAAGAAM